ncbi:MAG: hypothetical protein QOK35_1166, partial [Pseudonocardiales bacterium]|nr:hypothetical protein [Pseudonocardiales bacterium]
AQFLPSWYHLGQLLRARQFPLLDPTLWAGGNIAAEALFGVWNPVLLATMLLVSAVPNLVVASVLVKAAFLVILALGVYGLAREYDVPPGLAAVAAVTVPFAGVTLYFDAASWSSGLTAFAFVPWYWWTLRRSARGALSPLVPFVAGYLAMTAGNPYGALGACLAVVGLLAEFAWTRRRAAAVRTLLGGVAVGLVAPLTYLPLVLTQSVTYRSESKIGNSGLMVPGLGDLLNASTPSFAAWVDAFEHPYLTVPATYLAWYALPLLPWLRYRAIVDALASRMAVPIYTVVGLALSVGPSEAWMFRWPLRVVPYFVLPTAVLLAIALAQGLSADHRRRRATGSLLVILGGAYLAEATRPDLLHAHAASVLLVAALTAATVAAWLLPPHQGGPAWRRRLLGHASGPTRPAASAVLLAGCVAVLAFQVVVFPRNTNLNDYRFPTSITATSAALVPRYPGTVLEVANNAAVVHSPDPGALSSELVFGNMLQAVGVHAVNSYYGMGYKAFTDALCIEFNGSVCPDALRRAFQPAVPGGPPLADLLKLDTVVVQNGLPGVADGPLPAGWRVAERTVAVTVLRRDAAWPHPQGRLSDAPPGTAVTDDVAGSRGEEVRIAGGPGGTLTFARLAWPGYTAEIDGVGVPVRQGPAGLLTVDVPPGAHGLALSWSPPAFGVSLASALLGLALALAHAVARAVRRRPRPVAAVPERPPVEEPVASR